VPAKTSIHAHGASELKGRPAVMREVWRELKALGLRLRSVRERKGLTQEQAAEKIGLHAKHLQRVERGTANVTFATLVACERAYGTPLLSLLSPAEDGEPFTRLPAPSGAAPSAGREARPFVDAIPLYSLEAAAGAFGRFEEVRPEAWVATRGRTQPAPGLFVARVVGESMNRRIPSGSYCIFRAPPAEPLGGKIVLAQHRRIEDPDHGGQYTVKSYERDGRSVRLEPLSTSRRYRAISLRSPEGLSIVAELVEVLR
jgi:transcriptional regulator with XRE-family HTH domain